MKQIPISFKHRSETSGGVDTFTPSAASTSALPQRLLAARLPCFATGNPAPAITNAAAVETLKVFAQLEPVPAVSTKTSCSDLMCTARSRIASARPASSATVSPLSLSAINAAAICASLASSRNSAFSKCADSSRERLSRRIRRPI